MSSAKSDVPEEQAQARRGFKLLGWIFFWFNIAGIAVLTAVSMLLGEAVIGSFIDPGTSQTAGRIGWFFTSLMSAVCTMIAIDFILAVATAMGVILYAFFGKRRRSDRTTDQPPGDEQPN